ncbi:MAG: penicillin-binding protein 2 [Alphaproteobacteria bacterium]
MNRDYVRYRSFTRRALLLGASQAVLASALAARLYYLQVLESDRYKTLADQNRISIRLLPPPRGGVVDRNGKPLALNRQNYRVIIVAEQTPDVENTLTALGQIVDLSDYDRKRTLKEISRKRPFFPVTIRENLSWEEVARIEVNTPDLPGISIDVGQTRDYPMGETAAHVLGYVAAVSEEDLAANDPLLEIPGFRIGKSGIEKIYDVALRGKAGTSEVEVNAIGRVIRELSRNEGEAGAEMRLALDRDLQDFAVKRFGEESGSAVVLDVTTGAVLAMVSTPGFDPNAFSQGLSQDYWQELVTNPRGPLNNKAIAGQYAPGSTFKVMVALAGLENGIITPQHRVFCSGSIQLGDSTFHCWKKEGHGSLSLPEGIMKSCDVFFYDVAKRVGIDRIAEMARKFGFGKALGVDLPGERPGVMPTSQWKLATFGVPWQQGETLVAGIGQGYVLATPLQLAVMAARIANGGLAVRPHMARDLVDGDVVRPRTGQEFGPFGVSPKNLKVVADAMAQVTNNPHGTAYAARISEPGMEMAGKTGTAQVRRITKAERLSGVRKNEDLPWVERDHALFVAFAPVSEPRYACAVVVEHGGGGSKVAAPIARDILLELQRRAAEGQVASGGRPFDAERIFTPAATPAAGPDLPRASGGGT